MTDTLIRIIFLKSHWTVYEIGFIFSMLVKGFVEEGGTVCRGKPRSMSFSFNLDASEIKLLVS